MLKHSQLCRGNDLIKIIIKVKILYLHFIMIKCFPWYIIFLELNGMTHAFPWANICIYAVIMIHCVTFVAVFVCASFCLVLIKLGDTLPSPCNSSMIDKVGKRVWEWEAVQSGREWMEGADGWRTKDLQRLGFHLKACSCIDFPPDLLWHTQTHTHTHNHISFIYISSYHGNLLFLTGGSWTCQCVCVCLSACLTLPGRR